MLLAKGPGLLAGTLTVRPPSAAESLADALGRVKRRVEIVAQGGETIFRIGPK